MAAVARRTTRCYYIEQVKDNNSTAEKLPIEKFGRQKRGSKIESWNPDFCTFAVHTRPYLKWTGVTGSNLPLRAD